MDLNKFFRRGDVRVYALVAAVALCFRLVLFADWLHSPLRYFHRVPGLDMMTLLEFGEWGGRGVVVFAPHRMLVALLWKLGGEVHQIELLALVQLLCGVAVALMAAYAAFRLWGHRRAALVAGLIAAFYAPAVMYEFTMLQETLVLFTFSASFAGLLWARKHHFLPGYAVAAGALLGFASIGRPTALLWVFAALGWSAYVLWRRGWLKRVWPLVGGVLAVWVLISALNWFCAGYPGPFYHVLSYSAEVNAVSVTASAAESVAPTAGSGVIEKLFRIGWNAAGRMPNVFLAYEIPENMNYYFIREYWPPLKLLIGPGLLVPFALAGLALVMISRRFLRREGLILLAVLTLALPICANYPVGRYRLILLIPFVLLAIETFRLGMQSPRRVWLPVTLAVLAGAFLINPLFPGRHLRSSDFISWALAQEQPSGKPGVNSLATLAEGYRLGDSESVTMNLLIRLIQMDESAAAEQLIADALERGKADPALLYYYGALLKMERGDALAAEALLKQIGSPRRQLGDLAIKYFFLRGEAARLRGDVALAREYFRLALGETDPYGFRPMIERAQRKLESPSLPGGDE